MLDVIFTTYNRVDTLRATMASFMACTDLESVSRVIIANDGSTDGTAEYLAQLQAEFPKVEILPGPERRGIIPRFNQALQASSAGIVCECQDDLRFYPGWLEAQLEHIDAADFVTGYDAREHQSFGQKGQFHVKHSTRFTQLLARRKTWDRFFPMVSRHPFPTPTVHNGRPIGSGIDLALSGGVRNPQRGKTKFLVVPGLLHTCEHDGSTWRGTAETCPTKHPRADGGLSASTAATYWQRRHSLQGGIAVGYGGRPEGEQALILAEKRALIAPHVAGPGPIRATVDYGCGVGLFSDLFPSSSYIGLDLTAEFLQLARERNPAHKYQQVGPDGAGWPDLDRFEQFITCNVLQHNADAVVLAILRTLKAAAPEGLRLALYENTDRRTSTHHMRFRTEAEYLEMVASLWTIHAHESHAHTVHGQRHSLMLVQV